MRKLLTDKILLKELPLTFRLKQFIIDEIVINDYQIKYAVINFEL